MENLYCRFCAEPKTADGMFNLDRDLGKCKEIHIKLLFVNDMYVDVLNSSDILPKTVCFTCYDSLNKAYDFLDKLKKAQDEFKLLTNCFLDENSNSDCGDDRAALEEFFNDSHEVPEVKEEISTPLQNHNDDDSNFDFDDNDGAASEELNKLTQSIFDSSSDIDVKAVEDETDIVLYNNVPIYKEISNVQNTSDILKDKHIPTEATIDSELIQKPVKDLEVGKKIKSWKKFVWACALCDKEFTNVDALRMHCKATHNKCAAFTCIDCEKTLEAGSFDSFVKHVQRHRKGLRNICYYCDNILEPNMLDTHVKEHSKTLFGCPTCGDLMPNEETLQQHLAKYSEIIKKPRRKRGTLITTGEVTCDVCKKVYKNKNCLRDHVRNMHTGERARNYTCDRCGKAFLTKSALTGHIMSHDVRPYVCKICKKTFAYKTKLRNHVTTHTTVKPFTCEICGRNFRLKYQLKNHKIVHTDSTPYECKYCKKSFRFKQVLANHERQHTGIKPYSCEHCGKVFTNWSNYNKHMKRRHKLDMAKKKTTPQGVFPVNPRTGKIIQPDMEEMEEWKTKVMMPVKRGKKKQVNK